jgi:hypothetical protein
LVDDLVIFTTRHAVEEQLILVARLVLERRAALRAVAEIFSVVAVIDSVVPDRVLGAADEGLVEDVLGTLSSYKLTICLELTLLIFLPALFSSGLQP